jgi:hypothetical protein
MTKFLAGVALAAAIALAPTGAAAHERTGDAALGAIAGGVVFGPVGAIAGGVVGYVRGPEIACGWRIKRNCYRRRR